MHTNSGLKDLKKLRDIFEEMANSSQNLFMQKHDQSLIDDDSDSYDKAQRLAGLYSAYSHAWSLVDHMIKRKFKKYKKASKPKRKK